MDVSKFLAKVIGIYLIIISISMLMDMNRMISIITSLFNDTPLLYVTGIFTFILGILLVAFHNIWRWNWRLVITLIAWIVLLKGLSVILAPQFMNKLSLQMMNNANFYYTAAIFDLFLGIILSYFGYKQRKV